MVQWRRKAQEFLDELMRHETYRNNCVVRRQLSCVECSVQFSADAGPNGESMDDISPSQRMFRCMDCFHSPLVCVSCCLQQHERLPLHVIQVTYTFLSGINFKLIPASPGMDWCFLEEDNTVRTWTYHAAGPRSHPITMLQSHL